MTEDDGTAVDLPLLGVQVVEMVDGPMRLTARLLADLGAHVVSVDASRLAGVGSSPYVRRMAGTVDLDAMRLDRGKHIVTIETIGQLQNLIDSTDILLEDASIAAPDSAQAVLFQSLRVGPDVVVVAISDFGRTPGFETWRATDPVIHALSGELARSGLPDRKPLLPPGDLAITCAATQAAYVALLSFYARLESGAGDWLDFSILDGAVQTLDPGFGISGSATAGAMGSDTSWGRPDVRFRYPIFACADGYVRLCLLAPRQWQGMFAWMGSPEEFADPSFDNMSVRFDSPTLLPAIARFFADQTVAAIEQDGQRHGVPVAAVLTPEQAVETEQVRAVQSVRDFVAPEGFVLKQPAGATLIDGKRPAIAMPGAPGQTASARAALALNTPSLTGLARPAEGLRVLDLGVIVVGAESGRLLGDAGADVVKVENSAFPDGVRQTRDGRGMSDSFAAGQRNKRSLSLDLRHPDGKALFLDLVRECDVILSNFKPGTLDSLGLGTEILHRVNPRAILVDSSAYGPDGPASRRLGYGPLVRASAGVTSLWTYDGGDCSFSDASTVYPDHVAARLGVLSAIALLIRRRRTGAGGTASVAQSEIILDHLSVEISAAELGKAEVEMEGVGHDAPWGVFPCAGDDDWCAVTVRGDADWRALAPLLSLDDVALGDRAGRRAARARIEDGLKAWLADRSSRDAMTTLQAHGVPAGMMLRVREQPEFAYYVARGFYRETLHPSLKAPINVEARSIRSARWPDPLQRHAPLMGEHSADVLSSWLGLSSQRIADLIARSVVGTAPAATPRPTITTGDVDG